MDEDPKTIAQIKIKGGPQMLEFIILLKILFVMIIFFVIVGLIQYSMCKAENPKANLATCLRAEGIIPSRF